MTDIKPLNECVVLVTGAANGIGFALVDNFLKHGAKKAIIVDVNEEKGEEAVKQFGSDRAEFKFCDVTNENQVDQLAKYVEEQYGGVQILVNNAGVADELNFKRCIDINLTSQIMMTFKFYESAHPPHTIINVSSIFGFKTYGLIPVYEATKHGIVGFTKSLGHIDNYKHTNIRVLALCPDMTKTSLTAAGGSTSREGYKWRAQLAAEVYRNGVWQEADDVGKAAVSVYEIAESGTLWLISGGKFEKVDTS